ncbi:MAG: hypothetical protein DDT32_00600 [Syntrophomonadaceae bacterium]|nr:hypothetical protein [Bacillota bacterium]
MELKQKGDKAVIGDSKQLKVSLVWTSAIDLDLMAFYKTKDGRVGGIYSDNYAGGSLGDLNRFPFMQLSGDEGVGDVGEDNREELRITKPDDFEELYIVALNFTAASSGSDKVFANYDARVEVVTDKGDSHSVALDSRQSGSVAVLCKFTSDFLGISLVNNSDVMAFENFKSVVPGASAIKLASGGSRSMVNPLPRVAGGTGSMGNTIQDQIDKVSQSGTFTLDVSRGEYEGPLVIRKPMTIEGHGHSIWAKKGPVVSIEADGVILNNIEVEVTGNEKELADDETCAIMVMPGLEVTLNNVMVRGSVTGLDQEEGIWRYPHSVRLGIIKANQRHEFKIKLVVPIPCRLKSEIAGLSVKPSSIKNAGIVEIALNLDPLSPGTHLRGSMLMQTAFLTRQVIVSGNVARTESAKAVVGTGQVLWEPDDLATPPLGDEQVIETKPPGPLPKRPATKRQIPDHVEVEPLKKPSPVVPDTTGGPFKNEAVPTTPAATTEPANVHRRSNGVPVGGAFGKPEQQPAVDSSKEVQHETRKSAPEVEKKVEVKKAQEREGQSASSKRELPSPQEVRRKPRRVKTDSIGNAWD